MRTHPELEVSGITGRAVLQAFGAFTVVASQYLVAEGIGNIGPDGVVQLDRAAWYPLGGLLHTFERIRREFGDTVVQKIGASMIGHSPGGAAQALARGGATDLDSAIRNLDRAFHRNHRLRGRVLFDAATDRPLEGIGNYGYAVVDRGTAILSRCDNPYPCAFDLGLLGSLSRQFEPSVQVAHEPGPCRKQGEASCTYRITWKGAPLEG